ncbi:BLUF domain-containing protein [Rhodanobacter sp. L36]|uniref:BLUF domain-containing protein n=1 Tax=Rhodanobacter sp. L36 TaxID=1747221 RepID=UPI00131E0AF4|nr:BLUF domain-containing protein [Rhodanobacter sp. L36]
MKELIAVVYSSVTVRSLGVRDIDGLLMDAREFNHSVHVTGVLLHHRDKFFQYFEGAPEAVDRVYARIKRSSKHGHLIEYLHEAISARQFVNWQMGFAEPPLTLLDQLCNEQWTMTLPALRRRPSPSPGLKLLLDFWAIAGSH